MPKRGIVHQIGVATVMCALSFWVAAAEIAIIVPRGETQVTYAAADLEKIFRRRMRFNVNGRAIIPVNLPLSHPLRKAITRELYGLEPEEMEAYWSEQYFHGVSPPYVVASIEAMLRFVAGTPHSIGYVVDCNIDARVDVLLRLPLSETAADDIETMCADSRPTQQ